MFDYLRPKSRIVSYPAGATILQRGQPGRDFYVLLAGRVDVLLPGSDGQQLRLAQLDPGATFGEMSLVTGDPISADIVACGPAELLVYPGHLLRTALGESPAVREHVLSALVTALRRANMDMWNTSQHMRALNGLASSAVRTGPLFAVSSSMKHVQKSIADLAAKPLPVLITGGLGTGKLFIARKIHEAGSGGLAPFIVVDCLRIAAAEAPRLIFGSANSPNVNPTEGSDSLPLLGAIHLANDGSLVLQHIDALCEPALQALCSYLDVQSTHGTFPRTRVFGTTRQDSETIIAERPSLSRHFAGRILQVPCLHNRKRDILPLARLFLEEDNQRLHGRDRRFTPSAEHALASNQYRHHNVTELREAVEFAAIVADTPEIREEHIFTGPRDQAAPPEYDLRQLPFVSRIIHGQWLYGIRAAVLSVFGSIALLCLFAGNGLGGSIANVLIWGLWWPSLMLLFLFVGRVWCTVCPISTVGRFVHRFKSFNLGAPAWVRQRSPWLMAFLLVLIIWTEHIFHMPTWPRASGFLLLSLVIAAAFFSLFYEREVWCRYLCPLGGLSANLAVPAPLQIHANPNVCGAECTTHACFKGAEGNPGCPVFHHPLYAKDAQFCKLCLDCVRACPKGSARPYLRAPLWNIWGLADLSPVLCPVGLVAFFLSIVLLGSRGFTWTATPIGFSAMTALAFGCAVALFSLLPRLLSKDADPDPALLARICFGLMLLGWGPLTAFHLENVPSLSNLRIQAGAGSFWMAFTSHFSLLALIQLSIILFAAVLSAITFWRIGAVYIHADDHLSRRGWRLLLALAAVYFATAATLTVYRGAIS